MIVAYSQSDGAATNYEIARVTVALQHLRAGDDSWARIDPLYRWLRTYGSAGAARLRGRPGIPARLGRLAAPGRRAGQRRVRIDLHTTRSLKRSSRPWSSMQRCPLFRPCSVRHRSAPPNVANQRILKSQLNGMIAGPVTGTNSSSRTSAERALLALQCQQQGRQYEAIYHDRNMMACSAR